MVSSFDSFSFGVLECLVFGRFCLQFVRSVHARLTHSLHTYFLPSSFICQTLPPFPNSQDSQDSRFQDSQDSQDSQDFQFRKKSRNPTFQFPNFRRFQDAKILKFQNSKVPKCQNPNIPKFHNSKNCTVFFESLTKEKRREERRKKAQKTKEKKLQHSQNSNILKFSNAQILIQTANI